VACYRVHFTFTFTYQSTLRRNDDTSVGIPPNLTTHAALPAKSYCTVPLSVLSDMASSSTSSRAVFVWTLVLFTTFCYGVRAAPEAISRNIPIPPAVMQELKDLGLTENELQVSHQHRRNLIKGALHRRAPQSSATSGQSTSTTAQIFDFIPKF
jgi:hypothetical protein